MSSVPTPNPTTTRRARTAKAPKEVTETLTIVRASETARLLKLAADPTRLRAMIILMSGERNVTELCATLGVSQPPLSHHLALIRAARLVDSRRTGKFHLYSLTPVGRSLVEVIANIGD